MKIDRPSILSIGGIQPSHKAGKIEKSHNSNAGQDRLEVSNSGQVFQKLLEKVLKLPDVREERVEKYREQILRGEFNLDSESIAASLFPKNTEEK
ncbi:MAG: flagellar biosynthesis anti-sigma factor FlgM [Bacillota bacterium]